MSDTNSAVVTGVVAAAGTVVGGLVVVIGNWLSTYRQRRVRIKTALRLLRNDFYSDEDRVARVVLREGWWPDSLQLKPLARPEDFAVVASKVDSDAWDNLALARRRYQQLEAKRNSQEELPTVYNLWTTYKLLELGRGQLARYDASHKFTEHSDYRAVRAIGEAAPRDEDPP
jgi:hypothetical protein